MTTTRVDPRQLITDYISLTKPRIVLLLVMTALCSMFLAAQGLPDVIKALLVLGAGSLAAGGAHALNHWFEHDIDNVMPRTKSRPVASGRISRNKALVFGIVLNFVAFFVLITGVNLISAVLTLSATLFYIFVYTIALKRRTHQNIVIGGAAGAMPPLIGWSAITGGVDLPAIYLFAIIFMWTPPHFWALSLLIKDDYAKANIPMLPVVKSISETKKTILVYTIVLVLLTLTFAATDALGLLYFLLSIILGAMFIYYSWTLYREPGILGAKRTYLFSLLYLSVLFVGIVADVFVGT